MVDPTELVTKTEQILQEEGITDNGINKTPIQKLDELILPALAASRNIQSALYSWQPAPGNSFTRKLKNKVLNKVRNIVVAVLERTVQRQQKVNELMYQAIVELTEENKQLRAELTRTNSK